MRVPVLFSTLTLFCFVTIYAGTNQAVLNLDHCIEMALENNIRLKISREQVIQSDAVVKETFTGYLPKVSGTASYARLSKAPSMELPSMFPGMDPISAEIGNQDNFNASVNINQPLFTGGRIRAAHNMASEGRVAAQRDLEATQKDVVREVTQTYYGLLAAKKGVEAMDNAIELLEQFKTDLANAVEVGVKGEHELLAADVQLLNQKLSRRQALSRLQAAENALANLIGLPLNRSLVLEDQIPEPEDFAIPSLDILSQRARTELPEIRAMESRLAAINSQVSIARAEQIPSLFAQAGYSGQSTGVESLEWQDNWTVSLALQWNIFDWGAGRQKKVQAESRYRQLQLGLEELRNTMEFVVRNSYQSLIDAAEALDISRRSVEQSKRAYEVTNDHYQQGMVPNSELLSAQNSRMQSQISFYAALSEYHSQRADLEYLISLD